MREPSRRGSMPRTVSSPSVMGETQPIMRMVELLPAPFGPRKPNDSPRWTSKSMLSTAVSVPNCFTRPRAWINGVPALTRCTLAGNVFLLPGGGALERLGELCELVLVGERQLDARSTDACVEAGEMRERVTNSRCESRVDRSGAHTRF